MVMSSAEQGRVLPSKPADREKISYKNAQALFGVK